MHALEIYVSFQKPKRFWTDPFGALGHVEAFGLTRDNTWFFIDPNRYGTDLRITHRKEEIEAEIDRAIARSYLVLRVEKRRKLKFPLPVPLTCVAYIGHMFGVRAFTKAGLRRKLLALDAQEVLNATSEGKSRRQEGT